MNHSNVAAFYGDHDPSESLPTNPLDEVSMEDPIKRQFILYVIPPIDFKWEFLLSLKEAITRSELMDCVAELSMGWMHARPMIEHAHQWDKASYDEMTDIKVFFYPSDTEFDFGYVYKQGDNGTTFVVSQHRFPHLEWLSGAEVYLESEMDLED